MRSRLRPESARGLGPFPTVAALAAGVWLLVAAPVQAQEPPDSVPPPPPDSLVADSLALDSLGLGPAQVAPDSVSADTIFYNLPEPTGEVPAGWSAGVWEWGFSDIHASAANSVYELVAEVPGLMVLLGGDYGTPAGLSAFGSGGGAVRVFRDGFELFPLSGGMPDLARIGLVGIRRVRLERGLGEIRIEMWSKAYDDGRPYSLVEAGTGDLETNVFRGTYADPTALGGSIALGLERSDTRGPGGQESGSRTGSWVRYQLHRGDAAGVAFDLRKMNSDSDLEIYPESVSRTDWAIRGAARLAEGVVAEAYTGKSTHTVDDIRAAYEREGGSRSQHGLRLGLTRSGGWVRGELRLFGGDELPSNRIDLSAGLTQSGLGGVSAELARADWSGAGTSMQRLRAWTEPLGGVLSLFASRESGSYGSRTLPLLDVEPAQDTTTIEGEDPTPEEPFDPGRLFGISERTATRFGAALSWKGASISGALLDVETDTLIPLGLVPDRGGPFLGIGKRKGWEVWGSLPMPLRGLRFVGSLQQWDEPAPYLPEQIYRGALVFHRQYLESGNFEWWWTVGVRGHDPMTVPILGEEDEEGVPQLETVPFYQNWYARVQVRIVTVQIYVAWENFIRRPNLQHYPGRVLPITRTVYGIRWTMFN